MSHRSLTLSFVLLMSILHVCAQNEIVSGRVIDKENREALEKTTLQLYALRRNRNNGTDTTFVTGTISDSQGKFSFNGVRAGNYLLKATYLGYKMETRQLTKVNSRPLAVGDIAMDADAVQLSEAVVTANVPKMIVKDDTLIYNADAFRVPEGSVIAALLE